MAKPKTRDCTYCGKIILNPHNNHQKYCRECRRNYFMDIYINKKEEEEKQIQKLKRLTGGGLL
tara:strand:- start:386 stop:574 length:189 start_codon:yes stop_codon:yes gene_type:complete